MSPYVAMFRLILSAASVFAAASLMVAGAMMLTTTVGLRLTSAGYDASITGLILTAQAIGFVAGTIIGPIFIQRVGHIRVFAACAALICVVAMTHGATVNAPLWGLLRFIAGMCGSGMLVVLESWINAHATPAARGRVMGFYMVNYYASGALGQLLVAATAPEDYRAFSLAASLLVLSLFPLALTSLQPPPMSASGRLGLTALYRISPIATVGAFTAGFCLSSFYQLAPVSMRRLGVEVGTVAEYMAAAVFASMLLQFSIGRAADKRDRKQVIALVAAAASLAATVVAIAGKGSLTALFLATMLFMALMASLYPSCLGQMHNRLQGEKPVAANAGQLMCYGIGSCVGPLAVSLLMHQFGPSALFMTLAVVLAGYAGFVAWRLRVIAEVQNFARVTTVPVMGESTVAMAQMDPRTRPEVIP